MRILHAGSAGTLESSDVLITVERNPDKGIEIELESISEARFGNQIREVIQETLKALQVSDVKVRVQDRSALDCTIRARLTAAVFRAAGIERYPWEVLQ
jgi:citrate lyase subunit gamma (acyl carrier protein)